MFKRDSAVTTKEGANDTMLSKRNFDQHEGTQDISFVEVQSITRQSKMMVVPFAGVASL